MNSKSKIILIFTLCLLDNHVQLKMQTFYFPFFLVFIPTAARPILYFSNSANSILQHQISLFDIHGMLLWTDINELEVLAYN
jgi:hypothetical protein